MANFTNDKILAVWNKATITPNDENNGKEWRKDHCGAWINFNQYGKETDYGWEIDHAFPESKGGTDNSDNLRAMHWKNNRSKANDFPEYNTLISSENNKNIEKKENWVFTKEFIDKLKVIYPNNKYLINL